MKKRLISAILLLLAVVFTLASCKVTPPKPDGEGNDSKYEDGEFIFSNKSELYLIKDEYTLVATKELLELTAVIDSHKDPSAITKYTDDRTEPNKHELIIGESSRELTKTAMRRLDRLDKNTDTDVRFVIYSDGYSLAVVFDKDEENIGIKAAIEHLSELCDTDKLIAKAGVVAEECIDVYEYYEAKDDAYDEVIWQALADKVGGQTGQSLVVAMKQFYSLYDSEMVTWLANLYEPSICVCNGLYGETECNGENPVCGTAGFYYSNSARDNIGFLPDVESTYQALGFLNSSGMTRDFGHSWKNLLDDEMNEAILAFVRNIQREDGYFVHPQWQTPGTSRISRDLNWATSILNTLGAKPYYTTPLGLEGIGAPKSVSVLTGELCSSNAAACSKVIAAADSYLPQHKDLATFEKYLNTEMIKIKNGGYDAYSAGNTLTSQGPQILARDRELGLSGEGSLYNALIKFLNANQNPENGTWDKKTPEDSGFDIYMQVNGFMKISGIYGTSYKLNYVDKALETVISAITYDKNISAAVDIYNPWFALHNIFGNLEAFGSTDKIAELRQRLYQSAPETLAATRTKISICKKDDGSFSYNPKYSSATSQGCPAAVPNSAEGDVNGMLLSSAGLLDYIYTALGLSGATKAPLFGNAERLLFMNELRGIKHMNKPNTNMSAEPEDFESYEIGETLDTDGLVTGNLNSNGSITITSDDSELGNVLMINSGSNATDTVRIANQIANPAATTIVFECNFKLESASVECPVEVYMGSAYMFTLRVKDGAVRIVECSASTSAAANSIDNDLGVSVPLGQWFGVKVEYYYGDHGSVRIKFYLDSDITDEAGAELIAVSNNYYDKTGNKLISPAGTPSSAFTETSISLLNEVSSVLYIDNPMSYKTSDKFAPAADPDGKLKINVDATADKKVYNFESGVIPSEFVASADGVFSVKTESGNKSLALSSPSKLTTLAVPATDVLASGNCLTLSFDITLTGLKSGQTAMTFIEREEMGNVVGFALVGGSDGTYITLREYNGSPGAEISGARIPMGTKTNIRIEYYGDYRTSVIFVENEFVGATSSLCSGGNRRRATETLFSFNGGMNYEIKIDNLAQNRDAGSYLEAVKPDVDSIINDFEGANTDITFGKGASVVTYGGSKVAKLDSSSSASEIRIPIFERSKITSAISVALDIMYSKSTDGAAHNITVTDSDGNIIFGVVIAINGDRAELYEMSRSGEPRMLLASFASSAFVNVAFELYTEEGVAYIYSDGVPVAMTESFPYPENIEKEAAYLNITSASLGSSAYVDNVKAETLYMIFEKKTVNGAANAETDNLLTFEKSNTGSLPTRLHYSLIGSTSSIRIATVINGCTGEYSNAVVMKTVVGANDKIGIKPIGSESLTSYSCVTFETDIKLALTAGNTEKYWLYFSKNAEAAADLVYQVCIEVRGGKLCFHDRSNPNNVSGLIREYYQSDKNANEWHRLKVEYFNGDKDTARIRLSIDGDVVYVSNVYTGRTDDASCPPARSDIRRAYFYSFGATEGDLYLDNMSLIGSDATCTDEVGQK